MYRIKKKKISIPTYPAGKPESLPLYFEKRPYQGASGKVYPIPYVATFSDEKVNREYDGYVLENEYVYAEILPELGGKVHCAIDKTNGYEFVYHNKVIKPAMVGLAGPWVAGGIEFNWPQHHRPTTFMPVDSALSADRKSVVLGEVDYFEHMKGMVSLSLDEGTSVLRAKITVYNCTSVARPFMWWANLAVQVNDDYKIVFPPDVEYVNDHDRRAVLSWPVAKGVYHTARPFDYGKGTDIHTFSAVKVPSSFMISKGQSDMDFVSGYDPKSDGGVVTVADRHIAPGKKLWTWGDGAFGSKWCANLTDDGSRYVELMTGCYTDNQPDFTWIAPYETKTFEQVWFPVRGIGEPKNASEAGACNLEKRNGGIFIGFYSTRKRENCRITLKRNGETVFEEKINVAPDSPFSTLIEKDVPIEDLTLSVEDSDGKLLLSYRQPVRGKKQPIEPRKPAAAPSEISSVEELWLNGVHLRQYKHFAYRAEDYFKEGLRRDPNDIRCNVAMGDVLLQRGQYDEAAKLFTKAIERATLRNCNPYDTEPYYKRALCKFFCCDLAGAYEDAFLAVWSYPLRSAGYYLLAKISMLTGDKQKSIEFLNLSLSTNAGHLWAKYVLGILEGDEEIEKKIRAVDPLFFPCDRSEKEAIDFAVELLQFGLNEKAKEILLFAEDGAMKFYHLAAIYGAEGDETRRAECISRADGCDWKCEFPSRAESIPALKSAASPMAHYYLGCIYYNFERYEDACAEWECAKKFIDFAPAYRNLALGYYDHLDRADDARRALEHAYTLLPENDRIFYELTQLYKALNLPLSERLNLYRANETTASRRDDCTLQYSVLTTIDGDFERAKEILQGHRFHTYEGGEGYLTCHHARLHFMIGEKLLKEGRVHEAEKMLLDGLVFPENYGEEKNYFVNDAPLYYALSEAARIAGDESGEREYLRLALGTKGVPTIHSYYQCLALRKLGEVGQAEELAAKMIEMGEERIRTAAVDDYYGVGAPAYPPFGYDIVKAHTLSGLLMKGFGALASGNVACAKQCAEQAGKIDCAEFGLYWLKKVLND